MDSEGARPAVGPGDSPAECAGRGSVETRTAESGRAGMAAQSRNSGGSDLTQSSMRSLQLASGAPTTSPSSMASPGGQTISPSMAASAKHSSPQVSGRKRRNPGPRPRPRQAPQLREGASTVHAAAPSGSTGVAAGVGVSGSPRRGTRPADVYDGPARLTALPVDICLDILRFLSPEVSAGSTFLTTPSMSLDLHSLPSLPA